MAIEDKSGKGNDLIRGQGKQSPTRDLIRGASDPSTLGNYATKGFKHEGVSNSEAPTIVPKTNVGAAITPQVLTENNSPVTKVVKDSVKKIGVGEGMPANINTIR